jgi:hypothetical protein
MHQFTNGFSKKYKYTISESLIKLKMRKRNTEDAPRREEKRVAQAANSKSIP